MKRTLTVFFIFGFSGFVLRAQLDSLLKVKELEVQEKPDLISPFKKNFFHQFGGTVLFDFGTGNPTGRYRPIGYSYPVADSIQTSNEYLSLASITYEARYNLLNYKDFFSISGNLPVSGMFCIYTGHEGLFGFRAMPIIDFNFFNHATYNNINKVGFNFGGGYALNMSPLFFFDHSPLYNEKRVWASPVVRGGVKFPFKGKNCFVNCTYGFPTEKVTRAGLSYTKGLMFILNVGILINYE